MEPTQTENIYVELNIFVKYDVETGNVLDVYIQKEYLNGRNCDKLRNELQYYIKPLIDAAKTAVLK